MPDSSPMSRLVPSFFFPLLALQGRGTVHRMAMERSPCEKIGCTFVLVVTVDFDGLPAACKLCMCVIDIHDAHCALSLP
jgi:hypothetical protein